LLPQMVLHDRPVYKHDRPVYKEEHAAQLGQEALLSTKLVEYICADLSIALRFSLAVARRTIHCGNYVVVRQDCFQVGDNPPIDTWGRPYHPTKPLHRNADGNSNPGIPAVIHVVPVADVRNIDVIGVIPVICPGPRPWVNETNPIPLVLEARISTDDQERKPVDSEPMLRPKVPTVAIVRDPVTAVAATLLPGAVV